MIIKDLERVIPNLDSRPCRQPCVLWNELVRILPSMAFLGMQMLETTKMRMLEQVHTDLDHFSWS
jgi:hypothetical protein